jgi:hypothetical protein
MARIVQVSRGVATPYLRPLYTLVALPKIMYATVVFLNPATWRRRGDTNKRGGRAVINRLTSIQWWAAILVTHNEDDGSGLGGGTCQFDAYEGVGGQV